MPNVNLSTLSGPELRRLLDSARQRGEASLSYRILQEMEARRESGERKGLFPIRRSAEPRTVAVDLGDPMERDEDDDLPPMPFWRAPSPATEAVVSPEPPSDPAPPRSRRRNARSEPTEAAAPVDDQPAPPPEPEPPLSLRVADPAPLEDTAAGDQGWDLRLPPPRAEKPGPPRGLRRGLAAGFAVGIAAGVTLGWWVWGTAREPAAPPAAASPAPVQTAALEPRPAPTAPVVAEPAPTPEPAPEPAVAPPPSASQAPPAAEEIAPDAVAEAAEPTAPAPRHAEAAATPDTSPASGCAAEPTPADRTICGDPELRSLQRQLRQAYNEALEAHEDRALLRQRQLAWASARGGVSDPGRLAELYEQRIRKLHAATQEARRQR